MSRKRTCPDTAIESGSRRARIEAQSPKVDASKVRHALETHRPPRTETQREYVDRAVLTKVLKAARSAKPKCLYLLELMARIDSTGFYTTNGYRKLGLGRFYAKGASVQHLPKGVRAVLCCEAVADVDFERSAPTICLALCKCLSLESPQLEAIVLDRDAWLELTGCTKEMISKVMNGYSQQMHTWHDAQLALRAEMNSLDLAFSSSELSAPIRAILGERSPELRRVAVDTLEDCALSISIQVFERAGSLCVGRIYDGAHQLKRGRDGQPLDLDSIAASATAEIERALGFRLVARVKAFELPCDATTGEPCDTVEAASLFADDELPRPTKAAGILELVSERFDHPWFVVAPSDEERILVVRNTSDCTWSKDRYALKEYVKALEGELCVDPRSARLYDEIADFATKDAPSTVPGDLFSSGFMMRYGAHLLPFAHGHMLNLCTGAREAISPCQLVWSSCTLHWQIPEPAAYAELLRWSEHYLGDGQRAWMPATYAINASHVPLRTHFEPPSEGETELQCVARDVVSLLHSILGPLRETLLDRICAAFFERAHSRREFIILSGTGSEGKSLLFALLRLVAPALVVKAEALSVGGRGLTGNNESWFRAKEAAIVVTEEVDGVLDGNVYKDLSGGNGVSISCSKKYGHEIETTFRGLVILLTNSRLDFKPLDGALADRMLVARMPSKFVRSAAQAKAAYGEKAHVTVYAAFEDEQYVQRLFETDMRYRAALVACLFAHYRVRRGQYQPLDARYDGKKEYISQCSSNTPAGMFDACWRVDAASANEGRTAKDMLDIMKERVGPGELQWKNAMSLGCFLAQRYNGGLNCLPKMKEGHARSKVWYGFAPVDED